MDDSNQIEVPPSFVALYSHPVTHRLLEPIGHVRERYELSEDLAQLLSEQASVALFKSGGSEHDVLSALQAGLSGAGSSVQPAEAAWIATRVAEILGWDWSAAAPQA